MVQDSGSRVACGIAGILHNAISAGEFDFFRSLCYAEV